MDEIELVSKQFSQRDLFGYSGLDLMQKLQLYKIL